MTDKTLRKFRRERAMGRYLLNPAVGALAKLGVRTALASELETTGRRTGQLRRVPVSVQFDSTGAWVICQHGTRSGWEVTSPPTPMFAYGKVTDGAPVPRNSGPTTMSSHEGVVSA